MKERDYLRGQLRYINDEAILKKFKDARNTARQLINKARSSFVLKGLHEDQLAPKKYWKRLKKLMPGKKEAARSQQKMCVSDREGNNFDSDKKMATYI